MSEPCKQSWGEMVAAQEEVFARVITRVTDGIPLDRLEAICAAEREGRCSHRWSVHRAKYDGYGVDHYYHSQCAIDARNLIGYQANYCPSCGMKMSSAEAEAAKGVG
jgi:hypothetical protein